MTHTVHTPKQNEPSKILLKLEAEAERQQKTVEELKASGHACPDAERHLQQLRDSLALLK